jgi:hypothetical protein
MTSMLHRSEDDSGFDHRRQLAELEQHHQLSGRCYEPCGELRWFTAALTGTAFLNELGSDKGTQ